MRHHAKQIQLLRRTTTSPYQYVNTPSRLYADPPIRSPPRRHVSSPPIRMLERRASGLRGISDHRNAVITNHKSHVCRSIASGVH
jgi:hypothetical protein